MKRIGGASDAITVIKEYPLDDRRCTFRGGFKMDENNIAEHENKKTTLDDLKNVDLLTVDRDELVDIRDVKINTDLPQEERMKDFVKQIKNPYC